MTVTIRKLSMVTLCLMVAAVCTGPRIGRAELLGVRLEYPTVVTWDLAVDYVAGAPGADGALTVEGTFDPWGSWKALQSYCPDEDPASQATYLGSFSLTARIDKTSMTAVSGSLEVWSDTDWDGVVDLQRASSTDLAAFGIGGAGLFDFEFNNSSGDLVHLGGNLGVILDVMLPGLDASSFAGDFSNAGDGMADVNVLALPGDADVNGQVGIGDLGIVGANYDGSGKTWYDGDFNDDGVVNVGDLAILGSNYGTGTGATGQTVIPEPATVSLLILAALPALRRRTRS